MIIMRGLATRLWFPTTASNCRFRVEFIRCLFSPQVLCLRSSKSTLVGTSCRASLRFRVWMNHRSRKAANHSHQFRSLAVYYGVPFVSKPLWHRYLAHIWMFSGGYSVQNRCIHDSTTAVSSTFSKTIDV